MTTSNQIEQLLKNKLCSGDLIEFTLPPDSSKESESDRAARTIEAKLLVDLAQTVNGKVAIPIRISNAIIKGALSLKYVVFDAEVAITGSEFDGEVDLSFATFKQLATFEGSCFHEQVNFRAAHAESYFKISRCYFGRNAYLIDLKVDGNLYAESALFNWVDFSRMEVAKSAFFRRFAEESKVKPICPDNDGLPVRFDGDAYFWRARISGTAEFQGAQFKELAKFDAVHIGGSVYFYPDLAKGTRVTFEKDVRFFYAYIGDTAEFDGANFKMNADFERIKVGGSAYFRTDKKWKNRVSFGGMVCFLGAHIQGNMIFDGSEFTNDKSKAEFDHIKIDGDAGFKCDEQSNRVRFAGQACFVRSHFNGSVNFEGVKFEKDFTFEGAEVQGQAKFQGAVFHGKASFREAHCRVALFRDHLTRKVAEGENQFKNSLNLDGFTYQRITIGLSEIIAIKDNSPFDYDRQPYTQLEATLQSLGYDREADEVYIARRKREARGMWARVCGKQGVEELSPLQTAIEILRIIFDFFQRLLFNYGVRPVQLLVLSVLVIGIGMYMFAQPGAVIHKDWDERHAREKRLDPPVDLNKWQSLGVSLRLFIPIVELPTGGMWIPSEEPAPYIHRLHLSFAGYATVHRIAGAILVPLGVAALTGLIRRREKP